MIIPQVKSEIEDKSMTHLDHKTILEFGVYGEVNGEYTRETRTAIKMCKLFENDKNTVKNQNRWIEDQGDTIAVLDVIESYDGKTIELWYYRILPGFKVERKRRTFSCSKEK